MQNKNEMKYKAKNNLQIYLHESSPAKKPKKKRKSLI